MTVLKEIGIGKVIRYAFFSLWHYLFAMMFVSPLRVWLLRVFGARVGQNTVIERIRLINLYRTGIGGITIGDNCFLGDGVALDTAERIAISDDVTISFDVMVLTHTNVGYKNHPVQEHIPSVAKPTILKKGCFVGARATILPGITIGEGAAVAAGAVVTKNVPAKTLVGGVPAKMIRRFKS
ncbi:MAG: DapH/DapD/GlmU-related protein [Patescibacteria group bacterium]